MDPTKRDHQWYAQNNSDLFVDETEMYIKNIIYNSISQDFSNEECVDVYTCKNIYNDLQNMRLFYTKPTRGASTHHFINLYCFSTLNPYSEAVMGIICMNYFIEHIDLYYNEDLFNNPHIVNDLKTNWETNISNLDKDTSKLNT